MKQRTSEAWAIAIIVVTAALILSLGSCGVLGCDYSDIKPIVIDAAAMATVEANEAAVGNTMTESHVEWCKQNARMWNDLQKLVIKGSGGNGESKVD